MNVPILDNIVTLIGPTQNMLFPLSQIKKYWQSFGRIEPKNPIGEALNLSEKQLGNERCCLKRAL